MPGECLDPWAAEGPLSWVPGSIFMQPSGHTYVAELRQHEEESMGHVKWGPKWADSELRSTEDIYYFHSKWQFYCGFWFAQGSLSNMALCPLGHISFKMVIDSPVH